MDTLSKKKELRFLIAHLLTDLAPYKASILKGIKTFYEYFLPKHYLIHMVFHLPSH